jgi:hypothetical protein
MPGAIKLHLVTQVTYDFCLFPLCPFPILNKMNYAPFLYALSPFLPLSISAPFRIDGKQQLCPICDVNLRQIASD